MSFNFSIGKRCLSFILALLMVLSCGQNGFFLMALAVNDGDVTVSDGTLLGKQYALSEDLQALLNSGLLNENTYTYHVPTEDDELVQVDPDNRKISAKPYSQNGFNWIPIQASVISGQNKETVALSEADGSYVGSFQTSGNTYSVSVTYALHISVAQEQQLVLLNSGANLKHAFNQMQIIAAQQAALETLALYIDRLMELVNGIDLPWGGQLKYTDSTGAVRSLYNQKQANGGDFDLVKLIRQYYDMTGSFGKSKFLMVQGQDYYATAAKTGEHILDLCSDRAVLEVIVGYAYNANISNIDPALLRKAFDTLQVAGNALQASTTPKWEVLDNNPVKQSLSDEDYLLLDTLVEKVEGEKPQVNIVEKLLAQTSSIQVSMNRFGVTVKYVAKVVDRNYIDSADLTTMESRHTARITLDADTSYEDILAAVAANEMENRALADWEIYQVGKDYYDRTVTGISVGDTLKSDVTLTVTYTPKNYSLTGVEGVPAEVPYGYNLLLPVHTEDEKEYDYTVNGDFYRQNSVYRITGDTVLSREEGSPWEDIPWGTAISVGMSPEAAAVLSNSALDTGILPMRRPEIDCVELTESGSRFVIHAPNASSGIASLEWVAVQAWVVSGEERIPVSDFRNGTGSFDAVSFDKVEVHYQLLLNEATTESNMLYLVNLPYVLTSQANAQRDAMAQLLSKKDVLEQFGTYAGFLQNLLADERVGEVSATALTKITENCINKSAQKQQLFLYEYLTAYEENGLVWYYTGDHYEKLNNQFDLLREQLGIFIDNTPLLLEIMKDYMDGLKPGMAEDYYGKIDGIRKTLDLISLQPPHEAIHRNSGELELIALVESIDEAMGKVSFFQTAPVIYRTDIKEAIAPDKRFITFKLRVEEGQTLTFAADYPLLHTLSQGDVDLLQLKLEELIRQLNLPEGYYGYSGDALPSVGTQLTNSLTLNFKWKLKNIEAYVEGQAEPVGSFTLKKPYLVLPACTTQGYRYLYTINGKDYHTFDTSVSVTLSAQEMEFLRQGGRIQRQTIDIARQDVLDFIGVLNDALASTGAISGASFIPLENEQGNLVVVLRLSSRVTGYNIKNVLSAVAQAVLTSGRFSYVDMGGYPLRTDTKIHLQGILNALGDSGFSLKSLTNAIEDDGTIINMELPGYKVVEQELLLENGNTIENPDLYGAKLIDTQLDLAANATITPTTVKLYITFSDDGTHTEELAQTKQGLVQLTNHVDIHLTGGSANLVLTLTEKSYQKFLTAMLLSDNAQLSSMNNLDYGLCVEYLYELIEPLLKDDTITVETLENTAQSSGQELELSAAQDTLKRLQNILRYLDENVEYSNSHAEGNLYTTDAKMEANLLLDGLSLPETVRGMVAENGGYLTAKFGVQLKNVDNQYQALVIDREKPDNKKTEFVADLFAGMEQIHDGAIVILLDHVAGSISTDKKVIIDLNGKKLTGNVSGQGVVLVDSSIENRGSVTGSVDAAIKDCRNNQMYLVQRQEGEIQVYLNSALLIDSTTSLQDMAAALVMDLVFNFYTSAALKLDHQVIYGLNVQNLMEILENGGRPDGYIFPDSINYQGFSQFLGEIIADLTDYKAMAQAAADGKALAAYSLSTTGWSFTLEHDAQEDILNGTFAPAQAEKMQSLSIHLGGTAQEKLAAQKLLHALSAVLDTQTRTEINQFLIEQDRITVSGSGERNIVFRGGQNVDYAVVLCALLAHNRADKTQIITALETWLATENASALKMVIGNTTVKQLFDAIRSIRKDTDMAALVQGLGVDGALSVSLQKKLNANHDLLVYLSNQLQRMQVEGTSEKISTYEVQNTYGVYDFSSVVKNAAYISIMGTPWNLDTKLRVELFNNDPRLDDGNLQINVDGSVICGSKLDTVNKIIYLDTAEQGITVEQFNMQVVHGAINATQVKAEFSESTANRKGVVLRDGKYYVVNGAKVTFCASNNTSTTVAKTEYTVVLMGDVNSDGRNDISDSVYIKRHVQKTIVLSGWALMATDMNRDGKCDISDDVMIKRKCQGDNYKSLLK